MIDYIKSNNINVLFVLPIKKYDEQTKQKINSAIKTLNDNGFEVVNFNKIEELGIDGAHDFSDNDHLNVYGATKFTLYFSKYLKEKYSLPDHREENGYDSWKSEYERFKSQYKYVTDSEFDELLQSEKEKY